MKLNLIFPACVLFLNVFAVQAQQTPQFDKSVLSQEGQRAYEKILTADTFAVGGVGYTAAKSGKELALRLLLKEKRAIEALTSLASQATPEGSIYALIGLHVKDIKLFRIVAAKYKNQPEQPERKSDSPSKGTIVREGFIQVQTGLLVIQKERIKVVEEIESGQYDKLFKTVKAK